MASFNKVILIGNLTRDPDARTLPSGVIVAEIGLAVKTKYKNKAKEDKEDVCFITCTVFGKQAEACVRYLVKGQPILVEGRLKYETWTKDGQKRNTIKVQAEMVQFLGERPSSKHEDERSESVDVVSDSKQDAPTDSAKTDATTEDVLPF